jgi:hypothetical protein
MARGLRPAANSVRIPALAMILDQNKRMQCLVGAWIMRIDELPDRLVLSLAGIRRFGLVFDGQAIFHNGRVAERFSPRAPDARPSIAPNMTVDALQSEPGRTMLEVHKQSGPGEVDEYRFTISHRAVDLTLRCRPGRSLRAWVGFYPRAGDRLPG